MRLSIPKTKFLKSKKAAKKVKTKRFLVMVILVVICIISIVSIYYIKIRDGERLSAQQLPEPTDSNYTINCSNEKSCENCSFFISCINLIGIGENHRMYVKIKNQDDKQINCNLDFSVKSENKILSDKTYRIGLIPRRESRIFMLPYNYSIENIEFNIIPLCT